MKQGYYGRTKLNYYLYCNSQPKFNNDRGAGAFDAAVSWLTQNCGFALNARCCRQKGNFVTQQQ